MSPKTPHPWDNIIEKCEKILRNPFLKAKIGSHRQDAAIVLGNFDTPKASLILGDIWAEEDDPEVETALLDALYDHKNNVSDRLLEALHDELDLQRLKYRGCLNEPEK